MRTYEKIVLDSMKVICIKNNKGYCLNEVTTDKNSLTLGKVYQCARSFVYIYELEKKGTTCEEWLETSDILVMNDNGVMSWYDRSTIIPLDEWRNSKLNEIGIV